MHQPVLVKEVLDLMKVRQGGTYIDGTGGSGGHTLALLERVGPAGRVLAIDRDREALARLRVAVAGRERTCLVEHANYADMAEIAGRRGIDRVDGVLLDLGLSSEQIDSAERGFSFNRDGPLDMRMNTSEGQPAADVVNRLPERELREVLRSLGEEPRATRIARRIVEARAANPIATTGQLGRIVAKAVGGRRGRLHPATRTFQALRIYVNHELECLEQGLRAGLDLLAPGGRLAAISFHSLEDGIVKAFFRRHAGRWQSLQQGGRAWDGALPAVTILTRKPVTPGAAEKRRNPRCRSARLRVAERKE
jgi:16S rRNA (cytosine1402-N4)-methyltransferase